MTSCLFQCIPVSSEKSGLLLEERVCSLGSKFFPLRVDIFQKGGNNNFDFDTVFSSPKSVTVALNDGV